MDPELEEYLDGQFENLREYIDSKFKESERVSTANTISFTSFSIGLGFLAVSYTLGTSSDWLIFFGYGLLLIFFGNGLLIIPPIGRFIKSAVKGKNKN